MILSALVLPLEAPERPEPARVQGWFYRLLRRVDSGLHDRQAPPPFTMAVGGRQGAYWIRITLLNESLYAGLSPLLYPLAGCQLRLGDQEVRVRAVIHQGHHWAGFTTYSRLFRDPWETDFPLRFASPTFFKRKGAHYPLPEPKLVFGSLYDRFKAYAPIEPPAELPEVFERVTLRKASLRTRPVEHETRGVGIVGEAVYHLPRAGEEVARWLTALWRFSFYSGVGAKTTMGFGQVRPLKVRKGMDDEATAADVDRDGGGSGGSSAREHR